MTTCFGVGCASESNFNSRLSTITGPYQFSMLNWELDAILDEISRASSNEDINLADGMEKVREYFTVTVDEKRSISALKDAVETTLERQIRKALSQQGIHNPLYKYLTCETGFPPVNFSLEAPPHILVISPRDRIDSIREILLIQEIDTGEMERVEADVDKLEVSSLVTNIGGFAGTYPSFVTDDAGLKFVIDTAVEEWLHQYLVFKPLGFRYLLDVTGISRNYEIAVINETVADIVSQEIGTIIHEKYYADNQTSSTTASTGFDFNREMREIRISVDEYLAQGEIEQAEAFMEEKRQYLVENGYHIRKLNQAYFAFHGTYADEPTSVSPIGKELKQLRSRRKSLSDFLETAASLTSRQDLQYILK
ncbi:hypothetical protein ACFLV2_01275 [Chloroflexota bacterium]